jgi:hypothetical protein
MSLMKHRRRSVLLPMLLLLAGLWAWVCVPNPRGGFSGEFGFEFTRPIDSLRPMGGQLPRFVDVRVRWECRRAGRFSPLLDITQATVVDHSTGLSLEDDPDFTHIVNRALTMHPDSVKVQWTSDSPLDGLWRNSVSGIHSAIRTGRSVRLVSQGVVNFSGIGASIIATLWIVAIFISNRRYERAVSRGLCLGCGYSIGTLAVCPECGRASGVLR